MRRRIVALGSGLLLLCALTAAPVAAPSWTAAAWIRTDTATATLISASGILAPTNLRCTPKSGLVTLAIRLDWTAPTATATGALPSAYRVQVVTSGGTVVYDQTTTATTLTLAPGLLTIGTYVFRVRGQSPDGSWSSAWVTDAVTVVSVVGYTCAT